MNNIVFINHNLGNLKSVEGAFHKIGYSEKYQAAKTIRELAADTDLILVEGN